MIDSQITKGDNFMHKTVVIVDGYSTGRYLPEALDKYNITTIHVQSSPKIPELLKRSFHPDNFDIVFPYLPAQEIAEKLRAYSPYVILAGAESGVLFADQLNDLLGMSWNVTSLSEARRNKFKMIEALQKHGMPTAKQMTSVDPHEVILWSRSQKDWPIVLKPLMSTSSEDVYFCHNENEIREKARKILNKKNYLGIENNRVLAQSYLDGSAVYCVNSVSHKGKHLVTDVWHCEFVVSEYGHLNIVEHFLLPPDHPHFQALVDHNAEALDAVGIQNGPSHSELKFTSHGARLIETSARLMGGTFEKSQFREARELTQIDWAAMAIGDPKTFMTYLDRPYKLKKHLAIVWVHFKHEGTIVDDSGCHLAEELPSYSFFAVKPTVGTKVSFSKDTTGRGGGVIYLLNEDQEQLQQDRQQLLHLVNEQKLFQIETNQKRNLC